MIAAAVLGVLGLDPGHAALRVPAARSLLAPAARVLIRRGSAEAVAAVPAPVGRRSAMRSK